MNGRADTTAEAVLQRLLLVLPLAAREGGARISDLARSLDLDPRRILRDLEEFQARSYYLPAGLGDQFQLTLTREHLSVWTTGEFQRPVRLTPREALALELALRVVVRDRTAGNEPRGGGPAFEELRSRLVEALRTPIPFDGPDPAVSLGEAEADGDPVRSIVQDAVRTRRELRLSYLVPGREPEPRRVGPLLLAHAEGRWYLLARDLERDGHRAFRLDRVLAAEEGGEDFRPTEEDHVAAERFVRDGRIHDGGGPQAPEPFEAVVDYSSEIARWIRERGWEGMETLPDGGVRARHQVVDPEWLLRHVLSYGGEARVVEPSWMAERVWEAVGGFIETGR